MANETILKQSPSQTVGPFYAIGLVHEGQNNLVQDATQGERINIKGGLYDGDDKLVTDGVIEIWQADANGIYNHPEDPRQADADANFKGFGRCGTHNGGIFTFKTIRPGVVPYDDEQNQAPHILVRVFMRGTLLHAVTRLYFSDEPANANDPVLNSIDASERRHLIAQRDDTEGTPSFLFDIHMQGDNATLFFEP
jgi:protocatechuate 3,4-dioxygenase alpha subunit